MRKQLAAAALTLTLCGSLLAVPARAASEQSDLSAEKPAAETVSTVTGAADQATPETQVRPADPEGTVSFENLEQRVRENNVTLLMLQESIEIINSIDYDKLYDDLRAGLRGLAQAQWGMLQAGMPTK